MSLKLDRLKKFIESKGKHFLQVTIIFILQFIDLITRVYASVRFMLLFISIMK